jgi:hypothetical protein
MKTKIENVEVALPFCGFYESALSYSIDGEFDMIFDGAGFDRDWMGEIEEEIDFNKLHQLLAVEYVKAFENWLAGEHGLQINLHFEEMTSPREYNFSTDRIFVKCSLADIRKVFDRVADEMPEMVRKRFTSRDGFISFYDSEFSNWSGDLSEWDCNETGTLFQCLFEGEFQDATYAVLEWMSGNGEISDAIYEAATPKGIALMDEAYEKIK